MVDTQVELAGQDRTLVAYYPPFEFSNQIALPGEIPSEQLHLSLLILEPDFDFSANYQLLHALLTTFAATCPGLSGTISGVGRFTPQDTFYASVDVHHLHKAHDQLMKMMIEQGFPVSKLHPYIPHITLAYLNPSDPTPEQVVPNLSFSITSIFLVHGTEKYEYQLTGIASPIEMCGEEECMDLDNLEPELFEYLTKDQRDAIDDSDFAWPEQKKYPINTQAHLDAAAKLIGRAPEGVQDKIKRNAIRIAKRKGLTLPDSWNNEPASETTTVVSTKGPANEKFQPLPRIAQLKVRFLSDGAISRNGRQYPVETVQRLVNSGYQQLLAGDIINSYICHSVADEDNPLVVSGKATKIWHEGEGAYALFDIPDTTTGRDMVSLLSGGYIPPTMSLRAANAEMQVVKGKGVPQVVGKDIQLLGIDFTARPGIEDARIQDLVLENAKDKGVFLDSFYIEQLSLVENTDTLSHEAALPNVVVNLNVNGEAIGQYVKEALMEQTPQNTNPASEAAKISIEELHPNTVLTPLVSGNSVGVSDDPPGSQYTKNYPQIQAGPPAGLTDIGALASGPPEGLTSAGRAMAKETHDHIATALGMGCAPQTTEIGRKFNKVAENHLVAVHDMHARNLGYDCIGSYQQMQEPNNVPGDDQLTIPNDDKMESVLPVKQEIKQMSVEDALALLKQNNYNVTAPKTEVEKIQEVLEAKLEEQRKQFETQTKQLQEDQQKKLEEITKMLVAQQPAAQRKSLVENTTNEQQPLNTPRARRSHLQEQLMRADWQELADRSAPYPEGITAEAILRHFGQLMIMQYNEKYGTGSISPAYS